MPEIPLTAWFDAYLAPYAVDLAGFYLGRPPRALGLMCVAVASPACRSTLAVTSPLVLSASCTTGRLAAVDAGLEHHGSRRERSGPAMGQARRAHPLLQLLDLAVVVEPVFAPA